MTKKHFEALAAELLHRTPDVHAGENGDALYKAGYLSAIMAVTDVCAQFNPNFDRARFLKACGMEQPNDGIDWSENPSRAIYPPKRNR